MRRILTLLITSFALMLSGNAFAHAAPVAHTVAENNVMHVLVHIGILSAMGVGAFFISFQFIQRMISTKPTQPKH